MRTDEPPTNPNFPDLQAFRGALASEHPEPSLLDSLILKLAEQNLLEQALIELKRSHPRLRSEESWKLFRTRLESDVDQARARRMNTWQLDPRRRTLRLCLEIRDPACNLHPPALQAVLARALLESGQPLAMGLEKSPRPMIHLGHPLPLGVDGLAEWADVALREPPKTPLAELPTSIAPHCPPGLRILQVEEIPNHASPVQELCRRAHWAWKCPSALLPAARESLGQFASATSYTIEKNGKVDGQKQIKQVEVRNLVLDMDWEGEVFRFTTRLSSGQALNPIKLLAGVLSLECSAITGLTRLRVELAEDRRLKTAEKYMPKLHNIYEDAVLLESGSNIRIIEEDEDEPTVLRKETQPR
jgi:radical SAM-linked protein